MIVTSIPRPKQQSFYDQIEKKKQEGIELVFRNADTGWKKSAAAKLIEIAQTRRTFTSDDILIPLEESGIVTKDNRAIAAILQSASRLHLIRPTDDFKRSRRPARHRAPIMTWKSLIFKPVK